MQRHRIFIAINLPENIKKKLADCQKNLPELPIRWTKRENFHITLEFIGYVNNDELLEIMEIAKKVALRHSPFLVHLTKICYGPLDKDLPRMVWAIGEKSKEFASLRDDLERSLFEFPENRRNLSTSKKAREFSPHITLGRIRQWEWRWIEPEERPAVEEDINLTFEAKSIEVMESKLKKTGAEYTMLETYNLGF